MRVRVKLFAIARELAGADSIELDLPTNATVASVRAALAQRLPRMAAGASHMLIAIDNQYVDDQTPIGPDQEIACIPPVSGG